MAFFDEIDFGWICQGLLDFVVFAGMASMSRYKIKVEQISCTDTAMLAPPGCLTYDMGLSGTITSFNYDAGQGEMINNQPMFPGKHYLDQICKIQEVLGSPVKQDLSFITNPKAQQYVISLPARPAVSWAKLYPGSDLR